MGNPYHGHGPPPGWAGGGYGDWGGSGKWAGQGGQGRPGGHHGHGYGNGHPPQSWPTWGSPLPAAGHAPDHASWPGYGPALPPGAAPAYGSYGHAGPGVGAGPNHQPSPPSASSPQSPQAIVSPGAFYAAPHQHSQQSLSLSYTAVPPLPPRNPSPSPTAPPPLPPRHPPSATYPNLGGGGAQAQTQTNVDLRPPPLPPRLPSPAPTSPPLSSAATSPTTTASLSPVNTTASMSPVTTSWGTWGGSQATPMSPMTPTTPPSLPPRRLAQHLAQSQSQSQSWPSWSSPPKPVQTVQRPGLPSPPVTMSDHTIVPHAPVISPPWASPLSASSAHGSSSAHPTSAPWSQPMAPVTAPPPPLPPRSPPADTQSMPSHPPPLPPRTPPTAIPSLPSPPVHLSPTHSAHSAPVSAQPISSSSPALLSPTAPTGTTAFHGTAGNMVNQQPRPPLPPSPQPHLRPLPPTPVSPRSKSPARGTSPGPPSPRPLPSPPALPPSPGAATSPPPGSPCASTSSPERVARPPLTSPGRVSPRPPLTSPPRVASGQAPPPSWPRPAASPGPATSPPLPSPPSQSPPVPLSSPTRTLPAPQQIQTPTAPISSPPLNDTSSYAATSPPGTTDRPLPSRPEQRTSPAPRVPIAPGNAYLPEKYTYTRTPSAGPSAAQTTGAGPSAAHQRTPSAHMTNTNTQPAPISSSPEQEAVPLPSTSNAPGSSGPSSAPAWSYPQEKYTYTPTTPSGPSAASGAASSRSATRQNSPPPQSAYATNHRGSLPTSSTSPMHPRPPRRGETLPPPYHVLVSPGHHTAPPNGAATVANVTQQLGQVSVQQHSRTASGAPSLARPEPLIDDPIDKLPTIKVDGPPSSTVWTCPKDREITYTILWYHLPSLPDFLMCTRCYERHVAGTRLAPMFMRASFASGRCRFHTPRFTKLLLPTAKQTGDAEPLLTYAVQRKATPDCPGLKGTVKGDGIQWYRPRDSKPPGFVACAACFEDLVLSSPFAEKFESIVGQQPEGTTWVCDFAHAYTARAMRKSHTGRDAWDDFVTAATTCLALPKCTGAIVDPTTRAWYAPRRTIEGMVVCETCYLDHIGLTRFEGEFARFPVPAATTGSQPQAWACDLGRPLRIAMNAALAVGDYSVWWTAANRIVYAPPCSTAGSLAPFYTLRGTPCDLDICERCFEGIMRPLGAAQFWERRTPDTQHRGCDMNPSLARSTVYIDRLLEALDTCVWRPFATTARTLSAIPPCPRRKGAKDVVWYGFPPSLYICAECWAAFAARTPLAPAVPLRGERSPKWRICSLWSPRMRAMWLATQGQADSRALVAFADHRQQVYARTMPRADALRAQMELDAQMAGHSNLLSTMYAGIEEAKLQGAAVGAAVGVATGTGSGSGNGAGTSASSGSSATGTGTPHATRFGAMAEQFRQSSKQQMMGANDARRLREIARLEAEWEQVE